MPIARSKVLQVLSSTKKLRDSHLLPFPMWISGYPFPTLWSILQRLKANCSHVRIDLCLPLQKNQASLEERHQSKTAFYPHGAWDHMGSSQNRSMMSIGCVPKLVHDVSALKTTSNVGSHWQIKQGNCDWGTLNQRHTGKQRVDDRRNTQNVEQSRRLTDTIFASLAHFAQLSLSDHSTTQSLGPKHHHTLPTKPTAAHLIAGQQVDPAQSTELFVKWCEISTMESARADSNGCCTEAIFASSSHGIHTNSNFFKFRSVDNWTKLRTDPISKCLKPTQTNPPKSKSL